MKSALGGGEGITLKASKSTVKLRELDSDKEEGRCVKKPKNCGYHIYMPPPKSIL